MEEFPSSDKPGSFSESEMAEKITGIFKEARTLLHQPSEDMDSNSPCTTSVDYAISKWKPKKSYQTIAFAGLYAIVALVMLVNIFCIFIPGINILFLGYWVFIYFDRNASRSSGRPKQWVKNLRYWKWIANYFPMCIHVTQELDPKKTYMFGYHPHGVISLGALVCFASNGGNFTEKLPGIDLRLLTLRLNFFVPVLRELLLWLGLCDVSKPSIEHHLGRGAGNAVMIVVGGAQESLHADTGAYDLTLKNRKGFVKIALRSGSSLVPVFSFGETELFDLHHSDGFAARAQQRMKKLLGFTLPMFSGKGIWLARGLLPYQRPVHIVIGQPIDCPKILEPTQEDIEEYHEKYVEGVIAVFNANKKTVGMTRVQELRIS